ncbi:Rpp14 family protein [Nannizzia gypsea CBS 118893]|uniref:Ribonuclease P/MRP protein subunit POP5 n=1 Tax=Arthroderma gypseum (strain ATCC MYA-4604 / CBS 118893) TaxID=535722 RepID=E5R2C0_ARTGP|nr:Rpp14 family protein [Nannizzia gypsea CBS 118893]EFQ97010.1 Rpp14 family protein [Nannizzia gypsea CBS 118893]
MVRLKHRYLLVNILYPPQTGSQKAPLDGKAFHLQLHRPTADALTPQALARLVREAVAEMFGDWGMGRLGGAGAGAVSVKYLSPATSTAIIRCPRASYRLVWSALTYTSSLAVSSTAGRQNANENDQQQRCVFRVVRVSGTMKKAELEAIRRARVEVVKLTKEWESGGKAVLEGMFADGPAAPPSEDGIESASEDDGDSE